MFDDLVESSVVKKKTNTGWAVFLSTLIQVVVLIVLILIPLIYTQALPKAMLTTLLIAPPPPPLRAPAERPAARARVPAAPVAPCDRRTWRDSAAASRRCRSRQAT